VRCLQPYAICFDAVQSERSPPTGEKVKTFVLFATNYSLIVYIILEEDFG